MTYQVVPDFTALLNLTKASVKGYVIYDFETAGSQFMAATICGLNSSIAISPYMIPQIQALGIPQDTDLRDTLKGLKVTEVYEWGYRNLWRNCSRNVIGNMIHNTDYIKLNIAPYLQNSDTVYVKFEDAIPQDGNGGGLASAVLEAPGKSPLWITPNGTNEATYLYNNEGSWISSRGYRISDLNLSWTYRFQLDKGTAANLTLEIYNQFQVSVSTDPEKDWQIVSKWTPGGDDIGFPELYTQIIDYLVSEKGFIMSLSSSTEPDSTLKDKFFSEMNPVGLVLGWFGPNDTEWAHVAQASQNGLTVLCSFPEAPNFSLHSKIRPTITFSQNLPDLQNIKPEKKTYITFIISDGDALWTNNNFRYGNWLSYFRGQVAMGWEMSLPLLYLAPGMMQYYYETKSAKDEFVASLSGFGYTNPSQMPMSSLELNLKAANLCMKNLNMKCLYVIGTETDAIKKLYVSNVNESTVFFEGYVESAQNLTQIQNATWAYTKYPPSPTELGASSPQEIVEDFNVIANMSQSTPFFIVVHAMPNNDMITKLTLVAQHLNPEKFEVVTPYTFGVLASKAQNNP